MFWTIQNAKQDPNGEGLQCPLPKTLQLNNGFSRRYAERKTEAIFYDSIDGEEY